jgi:hypothetical protein
MTSPAASPISSSVSGAGSDCRRTISKSKQEPSGTAPMLFRIGQGVFMSKVVAKLKKGGGFGGLAAHLLFLHMPPVPISKGKLGQLDSTSPWRGKRVGTPWMEFGTKKKPRA